LDPLILYNHVLFMPVPAAKLNQHLHLRALIGIRSFANFNSIEQTLIIPPGGPIIVQRTALTYRSVLDSRLLTPSFAPRHEVVTISFVPIGITNVAFVVLKNGKDVVA
jgi:hypothetical protein